MNSLSFSACGIIEPLESRIAPAGDLIVIDVKVTLPFAEGAPSVPGDVGFVSFTVKNQSTTEATTGPESGIHFYFSADPTYQAGTDPKVGNVESVDLSIGPGATTKFKGVFKLPPAMLPVPKFPTGADTDYHILVQADPPFRIDESTHANNVTASAPFQHVLGFGDVGARRGVKLAVADADGVATFSIVGKGSGLLLNDPNVPIANNRMFLDVTGTDAKTALNISGAGVDLGSIVVSDPLFAANLSVNVIRNVTFASVNTVAIDNVGVSNLAVASAQITVDLGMSDKPVTVRFDRVADAHVMSGAGIAKLTVIEWNDFIPVSGAITADSDAITAPFIGSLTVTGDKKNGLTGDFSANLTLAGAGADGFTLGTARINGLLDDALWTIGGTPGDEIAGNIKEIAAGTTDGWLLSAEGSLGKLRTAGDLAKGTLANPTLTALFFGKIDIGGDLTMNLAATGANATGRAIKALAAGTLSELTIDAPLGGIDLIKIERFIGAGEIETRWIKGLIVTGNPKTALPGDFRAALVLTGIEGDDAIPGTFPPGIRGNLGVAAITGTADAPWTLASAAGVIGIGATGASWALNGSAAGSGTAGTTVKSLTIAQDMEGSMTAAYFGVIKIGGELSGDITALGQGPKKGLSIQKLEVGSVPDLVPADNAAGDVAVVVPGRIESIAVRTNWFDGAIQAGTIGKISGNSAGSVFGAHVTFTTAGALVLGQLKFAGRIDGTEINAPADSGINEIDVLGKWVDSKLDAGWLRQFELRGGDDPGSFKGEVMLRGTVPGTNTGLASFKVTGEVVNSTIAVTNDAGIIAAAKMFDTDVTVGGTLSTFAIADALRLFSRGEAFLFGRSFIIADAITTVGLYYVDPDVTGTPFGIAADTIARYTRYSREAGEPEKVTLSGLDAPSTPDQTGTYRLTLI